METILVVDDEEEIRNLLEIYLTNDKYHVITCSCGEEALSYLEKNEVDLAILDVMLPDMDGFTICKKIRKSWYFPIIMLTARNAEDDMINGLMLGADDYITKPFRPIEVTARVKTQLRRYKRYNDVAADSNLEKENDFIDIRGLYMNKSTHEVRLFEKELNLTPIEFAILFYLCERQGKVISSEELFEAVWGEEYINSNNTVMTHIGRLREKMGENARHPKFIKTVWGVGYKVE